MDENIKIKNIEDNILNEEAVIQKEKVKISKNSSEDELIEERKKKIFGFFKSNTSLVFIIVLVLLLILGFYIRNLPLTDHNGHPGLWDITTNDYTLGPDLDPFLFLRYAQSIIVNGSIPAVDFMRNAPLGFATVGELPMVSYMIVFTYKLVNILGQHSINYAGAFMPVIFFLLTVLSFFFFVKEVFIRKDNKENILKANIIASISTLFMIIIPGFLSRTVAGIPEKESVGFFFMFLAFYLFLKAWKSEKIIPASIFGILAGIVTALMGLTWGGVVYIYIAVAFATLIAFLLNKIELKETIIYSLWLLVSVVITFMFTTHYKILDFITSLDSGLASLVFAILLVNIILVKTNLRENLSKKTRIPENFVSIIVTILLAVIAILILFGPSFFVDKLADLNRILFNPVTGRWSTTVAENKQPYFNEWVGNFGIVVFWLFFVGSILLFYKMFNKIKKRDALIITLTYVLFLLGLIFSRYAAHPNLLDGENFISKFIYYFSALLLLGTIIYYYMRYHRARDDSFEKIEFEYVFLFALFVLTLFTARGAVRLIMVLVPIAPIFLSYLIVELGFLTKNSDKERKIIWAILFAVILILAGYYSFQYYNEIKSQSYNFVPYYYTIQWQNAMSWVRDYTPTNAIFAHWWDYGYWVQSIGDRATVTDGGNLIVWWNYLTGRLVLTGDNQQEALNFLYAHNTTNLLIDSSDISKYGAFSQIGSDENFDLLSQGPLTFISDEKNIQETKNQTIRNYNMPAGNGQVAISPIEEDIVFEANGTRTTLFKENTGIIGVIIIYSGSSETIGFEQPQAIFYSNGKQTAVPMRYLAYGAQFKDYGSGLNATAFIISRVSSTNIDNMGAMLYISPRVMRGLLAQLYILNDPFGSFKNFKLAHSQKDIQSESILNQGYGLSEFVYFYNVGLQGPIKIWNITYTGNEVVKPDYLRKTFPDYITWKF